MGRTVMAWRSAAHRTTPTGIYAHDYATPDLLLYAGRAPGHEAVLIATGMHKWGLSNGTAVAGVLRDLIVARDNPSATLYDAARIGDAVPSPS
jgi:glycine/D-amino acid oxidase-like deaminating enzyme